MNTRDPKKGKTPKSKENGPQKNLPAKKEDQQIDGFLNLAFDRYKDSISEDRMELELNMTTLEDINAEFMSDFWLIGHTILGQRVMMRHVRSPRDADALNDMLKRAMIKTIQDEQRGF